MKKIIFILIFNLLIIPAIAKGAILYLDPDSANYYEGDTFIVKLKIETEGECINVVDLKLNFPKDVLEAVGFSEADSILSVWLKRPEIRQDQGLISLTGGIPGGFCGKLLGELGEVNLLGKAAFKVKHQDVRTVSLNFSESHVLLNDGVGTEAPLELKGAVLSVLSGIVKEPKEEWQAELKADVFPPEVVRIEVSREDSLFDGKYFIVFSSTDKQTGIDHFEVKEGILPWKTAVSPYLLENQGLQSIIRVKAVDRAGNERISEWRVASRNVSWWFLILVLLGLFLWAIYTRFLKKK
ncbi:MAG: hypothetical protein ABH831_02550 [Candidatus Nealsonbacteria bacterium]